MTERSTGFNLSVDELVDKYSRIKDAFVEADMVMVKSAADSFMTKVESLDTNEIKKDTLIYEMIKMNVGNIKDNIRSMLAQKNSTEMRRDFSGLSESMYSFLRSIKYKGPTIYFQNCPMAFNDNEPANWLSKSPEVINPYLGNKHPKYKAGMLHCGEIVDSIISKP